MLETQADNLAEPRILAICLQDAGRVRHVNNGCPGLGVAEALGYLLGIKNGGNRDDNAANRENGHAGGNVFG